MQQELKQAVLSCLYSRRPWVFVTLAVIIFLNHMGAVDHVLDRVGRGYIAEVNAAYLHQTKLQISENILLLSAVDGAMELLKSSSAGVSFIVEIEVKVGAVFSTVQSHVETALTASLIALGNMLIIEEIVKHLPRHSAFLLTAGVLAFAIKIALQGLWYRLSLLFGKLSITFILLTFLVHLGLPLALFATAVVSDTVVSPVQERADQQFSNAHKAFVLETHQDVHEHVKAVFKKYQSSKSDHHFASRDLGHSMVQHVVSLFLKSFVFPLAFVVALHWMFVVGMRHLLARREEGM